MAHTSLPIAYGQHRREISAAIPTWLLFCAAVIPQLDQGDVAGFVAGAALGVVLVAIGFLASGRTRTLPWRPRTRYAVMALASLGAGVLVGAVILGAQLALATRDRSLHAQLGHFAGESISGPLVRAYSAAVFEEVIVRLFAMSVIAWISTRRGRTPDSAFRIALWTSTGLFALGHFPDPTLTGLMVLVFNGLGGVLLGWFFWRWGLPYAILCHFAGGVVIQSLGPRMVGP